MLDEKTAGMNIRVANMSIGGWRETTDTRNSAFEAGIESMSDAGIIVAIAAGNEGQDIENPGTDPDYPEIDYTGMLPYPAAFAKDIANAICVGAVGTLGEKASYSNYSPMYVHIAAPGGNFRRPSGAGITETIYSTIPTKYDPKAPTPPAHNAGYDYMQGTSMAAPHIAGITALMFMGIPQKDGENDATYATRIKTRIINNGSGTDLNWGKGKVNLYEAAMNDTDGGDPFVYTEATQPIPDRKPSKGGSGCEAGFGVLALLVLVPFIRKRR